MNHSIRAFLTLALAGCLSVPAAFAGDSGGKSDQKVTGIAIRERWIEED